MAGDESGKPAKGRMLWNKAITKTSPHTESSSPEKEGTLNLWNVAQMAMNQKKAARQSLSPVAQEAHEIHLLMTKNISEAFQIPINEGYTLAAKAKVAPNLLSKLAATADTEEAGRYDLSNQSELTPFRPTYTEANIKDIIKHDFFKVRSTKYDAKDFVSAITTLAGGISKEPNAAFDANPLLKCFEAVTEEILKIKKKVKNKIEDQEDAINATEVSRRQRTQDIQNSFEDLKRTFGTIEIQLTQVAKTAIRIGEQLEQIDKQRKRAADAKEIILYFAEFNCGNISRLEELRKCGHEGEKRAAIIAKRLVALSKEMDIIGFEQAKATIEKYCEMIETEFLEKFDHAYKSQNPEIMNHTALVLYAFNGGHSCIRMYLNQHDFFTKRVIELMTSDNQGPTFDSSKLPDDVARLYSDVVMVCKEEWDMISAVFVKPAEVMQLFIQRIFAQSIQTKLEMILAEAKDDSIHSYLEILTTLHSATSTLIADLHRFDETIIAKTMKKPSLTYIINRSFEDLFIPFLEGDRYIKVEHQWLSDSFTNLLASFHQFAANHAKVYQKNRTTMSMLSGAQIFRGGRDSIMHHGEETELVTINTTLKMIKLHLESIKRITSQRAQDLIRARHAGSLFLLLVNFAGTKYINMALDMILLEMDLMEPKAEPTFKFFPIIQVAYQMIQLFQLHFKGAVTPVVSNSVSVLRDMIFYKNEFISTIEAKLNAILQRSLDLITSSFEILLSRQKKTDYKPKEDAPQNIDASCTHVCISVIELVRIIGSESDTYLDPSHREVYLSEACGSLHSILLDHFKKFPVNAAGGLIITKDIQKYHEVVTQLGISVLGEKFDLLREIGSLFIVKPENLKTVIQEGYLSRIEVQTLQPYLMMRSDWSKLARMERELLQNAKESVSVH